MSANTSQLNLVDRKVPIGTSNDIHLSIMKKDEIPNRKRMKVKATFLSTTNSAAHPTS